MSMTSSLHSITTNIMGNCWPSITAAGHQSGSSRSVSRRQSTKKKKASNNSRPANLYVEARDMAVASFLVYTFGYVMETARRHPDTFAGMVVDKKNGKIFGRFGSKATTAKSLPRTFTPRAVAQLIEQNAELLDAEFPRHFKDPQKTLKSLKLLQKRIDESGLSGNPLTLQEYDDKHQKHGPVYAVAVDQINKRVTLAFRGTDNDLAFKSNWKTNASVAKTKATFPTSLAGKFPVEDIQMHAGFYNYLFGKNSDDTADDPTTVKFDEILKVLKPLLKANPSFQLYVTGHSLGGALAVITSFFLAASDSSTNTLIPKPVTCFTFGAPRIGNSKFLLATNALEASQQLRICRVVNDNDSVAALPVFKYHHVGMEVRLFRNPKKVPLISHASLGDSSVTKMQRTWRNSVLATLNAQYDHSDYRERVGANIAALKRYNLDTLYAQHLLGSNSSTTAAAADSSTKTTKAPTMPAATPRVSMRTKVKTSLMLLKRKNKTKQAPTEDKKTRGLFIGPSTSTETAVVTVGEEGEIELQASD